MYSHQTDTKLSTQMYGMSTSEQKACLIALILFHRFNENSDFAFLAKRIAPYISKELKEGINYKMGLLALQREIDNLVEGTSLMHPASRTVTRSHVFVQKVEIAPPPIQDPPKKESTLSMRFAKSMITRKYVRRNQMKHSLLHRKLTKSI